MEGHSDYCQFTQQEARDFPPGNLPQLMAHAWKPLLNNSVWCEWIYILAYLSYYWCIILLLLREPYLLALEMPHCFAQSGWVFQIMSIKLCFVLNYWFKNVFTYFVLVILSPSNHRKLRVWFYDHRWTCLWQSVTCIAAARCEVQYILRLVERLKNLRTIIYEICKRCYIKRLEFVFKPHFYTWHVEYMWWASPVFERHNPASASSRIIE